MRERYGDVARDRWPVPVLPLPDEALSSWIHRLSLANGIAPQSFASVFGLLAGRADALAIIEESLDAAIDWKSDMKPTPAIREAHVQQLHDYLSATGAVRGAIVYLTSGEIAWILPH